MHLEHIRCSDIRADPRSGRSESPDDDTLADSIRRHGVLRPILLRAAPAGYVIVHGERRWRAAQKAGLQTIPALIVQDFGAETEADGSDAGHPLQPASHPWEFAAADD